MKRLFRVWSRYAALLYIAACAGGASSSADPSPARVDPPQMLSREIPPQLRIPVTSSGRSPVRVTIEVMVDSTGIPDMATFKAAGFGAAENRDALSRWIQQVMFRPARLDGHSVRGLYRMKLEARVQVR